ncbi:uncharacterized protein B0J16DRAFT_402438 [Fusarium flagelliforme]|uniref:uncharacterized protein n=1 Tax=Fusarium flagelliforme TaxID=2675880 RepID=UPI001E8EBE45|nr:uncharacterized protein B0J16DRAFT_402438 [Fusarium flagelliforme]KAH7179073.1 hypothetical protein B0J16DRAFT_402438 [Fusarium flagelliforme]
MATGPEALGAASAVIQLISFSTSVISNAIDIYQGRPLSDSSVKEYAGELQNAVAQVELCCQGANMQQSVHERKIKEVAEKCQKSAQKLLKELRSLSTHQSGKARSAFSSALIARYRQNTLQGLEGTLRKQKEVLETHLLAYICTQTQAVAWTQKKEFRTLSDHVKQLVGQIAAGNTDLESCVRVEHGETRAVLVKEVKDTGGQVTSEIATTNQRTRFLDSLKSYSMNQRYTDITDPEAATYQRIFAAYDRACDNMSEPDRTQMKLLSNNPYLASIDKGLDQFSSWLQTSDSLFWINGKPGSGKSTFMKTIVNSKSVKMLLERWDPRVEIISHFFWKIGSKPQNSVKGLLCTLSYQILLRHKDLLTSIPNSQDLVLSKSSYHDWSLEEAKYLLLHLLNSTDKYFCIFIDGLDEINEEEGSEAILNIVSKIAKQRHVKACVSSRPEHQLEVELTILHAQTIKMECFTAYDMQLYAEKELEPLKSSGLIQHTDYACLVSILVNKASGVFLWLCLATRSVKDGAKNGDSSSELYLRLEQLPCQLEDLYTDMWNRLNQNMSIYKEVAAAIFQSVISAQELSPHMPLRGVTLSYPCFPTIVSTGYAVDQNFAKKFQQAAGDPDASDAISLCEKVEKMIMIRSAGLLEMEKSARPASADLCSDWEIEDALWATSFMRKIQFIHRTAHDFLVNTEAGKAILAYSKTTPLHLQMGMLESCLCVARMVSTRGSCSVDVVRFMERIRQIVQQYDPDSTTKVHYTQKLSSVLGSLEKAYSCGVAGYRPSKRFTNTNPPFLGMTAQWELFDDFTASHPIETAPSSAVSDVWRAVWNRNFPPTEDILMSSIRLIKATSTFGSDWHSKDDSTPNLHERHNPIFWRHTPFTRLLVEGLSLVTWIDVVSRYGKTPISETTLSTFLDLVLNAASNVPNWDRHIIVLGQFLPEKGAFLAIPRFSSLDIYTALCQATHDEHISDDPDLGWVFYHQLPLRFMFQKVVRDLVSKVSISPYLTGQLDDILQARQHTSPWARLVIKLGRHKTVKCYQTKSQASFEALNGNMFTSPFHPGTLVTTKLEEVLSSLMRDGEATEVRCLRTFFKELAQQGHNLCIEARFRHYCQISLLLTG